MHLTITRPMIFFWTLLSIDAIELKEKFNSLFSHSKKITRYPAGKSKVNKSYIRCCKRYFDIRLKSNTSIICIYEGYAGYGFSTEYRIIRQMNFRIRISGGGWIPNIRPEVYDFYKILKTNSFFQQY